MKVLSKVGASQEHVRKALDVKLSIESTVSRIQKLSVVSVADSQHKVTAGSHGKQITAVMLERNQHCGGKVNSKLEAQRAELGWDLGQGR